MLSRFDVAREKSQLHRQYIEEVRKLTAAWNKRRGEIQARIDELEREENGKTDNQETRWAS